MNGKRNGKRSARPAGVVARLIARLGRPVVQHFSDLARESLRQPGSWQCLEMVYQNQPRTRLDSFFLNSRSARGARSRLHILHQEICRCVTQRARLKNPVKLISLGAGPGYEILGSLERLQGAATVQATCVDKEATALERGRSLAAEKGFDGTITYIQGNVLHMRPAAATYDIGILSGLIDYFDFEVAVSVLKMVRQQLVQGGIVLIANMRRHHLASTMSVLGNWNLVYREPEEVEAVLAESGYEGIEVWLEPEKVFCIGKGRKPSG